MLKYYRGLCTAVLNGERPDVDPGKFTLALQPVKAVKPEEQAATEKDTTNAVVRYQATLDWVEPFVTRKAQTLHLEIHSWTQNARNYLFVCVSPQPRETAIWKQLHRIRDGYLRR